MNERDLQNQLGASIAESLYRLQVAARPALLTAYRAYDLSPQQGALLWHLKPEEALPMSALADQMGCDVANITGIVHRLEARGLVQRQTGVDRRVKLLSFTPAGLALRETLVATLHRVPGWVDRLDRDVLARLADSLRQAADAASGRGCGGGAVGEPTNCGGMNASLVEMRDNEDNSL